MLSSTNYDTLETYFPTWDTSGAIFTQMQDMPWSEYANAQELDILYFGSHSGIKYPTSIVKHFSANHVADSPKLASILKTMYKNSWEHLWNAYVAEYSPLMATNLQEREVRSLEGSLSSTKNNSSQKTAGDTLTLNTTKQSSNSDTTQRSRNETTDSDNTTTVTDNTQTQTNINASEMQSSENNSFTYGFNTSPDSPGPTSKDTATGTNTSTSSQTVTNTGTTTTVDDTSSTTTLTGTDATTGSSSETHTGTETHAITDNTIGTETETSSKDEDETITRSKTGNSGMRMFAEILQSEFELWKFNYFEKVFEDIDKVLALSVF